MNNVLSDTLPTNFNQLSEKDFIFISSYKSLFTQGKHICLNDPINQADNTNSHIQKKIKVLFEQAKKDGIENPIMVGAIPFNKSQKTALFIPKQSFWFKREHVSAPKEAEKINIAQLNLLPKHDQFCSMVGAAIKATQEKKLDKVVLSRLLEINTEAPLDSINILLNLNNQNSCCYNFHVPLTNSTLVGASPELLVRKQGNTIYSQPLAGSSQRGKDELYDLQSYNALSNSQKDRYEHRLVTDMIKDVLCHRCKKLHIPADPSIISTPVLWHLSTSIEGELSGHEDNVLSIASLLHPTPALCGAPYDSAKKLISELEPFDRQFFGGIVGWCDAQGDGEWVVTIRCGEITLSRVRLFAGAGIVNDSLPESEWNETAVKFCTMLRAFGFSHKECGL